MASLSFVYIEAAAWSKKPEQQLAIVKQITQCISEVGGIAVTLEVDDSC